MADTIRPYLGKRTMELGAGIGNLSVQLAKGMRRYLATGIDAEHLSRLRNRLQHRRNCEVHHCDLESAKDFAPFPDSFDSVVCLNVLVRARGKRSFRAVQYQICARAGRARSDPRIRRYVGLRNTR